MKKLLLIIFVVFGFSMSSHAQSIAKNALGLRLGDSDGFGTEISYQRGLSENNRLELDLGWVNRHHHDAFRLVGLYQWVWNIEGGFNWYAGVGAGLGTRDFDNHPGHDHHDHGGFFGLIAGDIGIEYDFDFPLLISLDFRPEIGFDDYHDDVGFDIALGLRYQF